MFEGTRKRVKIVCDRSRSRSVRVFAFFEVFCFYYSFAALAALALNLILPGLTGYAPGRFCRAAKDKARGSSFFLYPYHHQAVFVRP